MEISEAQGKVIAKRAIEGVIKSLSLFKIDFALLPKDVQDAIIQVYVAGCTDTIEYLKGNI